jgi:hypothetical protein
MVNPLFAALLIEMKAGESPAVSGIFCSTTHEMKYVLKDSFDDDELEANEEIVMKHWLPLHPSFHELLILLWVSS